MKTNNGDGQNEVAFPKFRRRLLQGRKHPSNAFVFIKAIDRAIPKPITDNIVNVVTTPRYSEQTPNEVLVHLP